MCCFSVPIVHVAATQIFARGTEAGRQILVYSMNVTLDGDVAMILPLPVPPRSPDDAVRFIDLERYDDFFADLAGGFPVPVSGSVGLAFGAPQASRAPLVVHDVGAFEASFVPTVADFTRLDRRFRLPDRALEQLPAYRDWGFAVFKLKQKRSFFGLIKKATAKTIHPMAFEFPRRDPENLFFPTVHVHDGEVHDTARFDHTLYLQMPDDVAPPWERTPTPAFRFVDVARAGGVIDEYLHVRRFSMAGELPNRDTFVARVRAAA